MPLSIFHSHFDSRVLVRIRESSMTLLPSMFFFFQAEDGIRDSSVTGVQTCALPISLVVEKIANRFPYYHPGFYNGIFSLGITGGLLAPWTLGYIAQAWGIRAVMIVQIGRASCRERV